MSLDDALYDWKPQPRAASSTAVSTPEASEHELAFTLAYPWPLIEDADRAVVPHDNLDRCSLGRMADGVLGQIAHRLGYGVGIAFYPYGSIGVAGCDALALRQCQRCDELGNLSADGSQIGPL
jgi:hypothetical protein